MTAHPFADRLLPTWYDEAKFGIFIHWGPYAVPCYAPVDRDMGELMRAGDWAEVFRWSPYTEWYLNSWSLEGSPTAAHHAATYGDRTYADFVDEFRSRALGVDVGHWAELFGAAGAQLRGAGHQASRRLPDVAQWCAQPASRALDGRTRPHRRARLRRTRAGHAVRALLLGRPRLDVPTAARARPRRACSRNIPSTPEYADYATAHVHELIQRFSPSVLWNDIGWPFNLDPNDIIGHYYDAVPDGVVNDRFNMIGVATGALHADFIHPRVHHHRGRRGSGRCAAASGAVSGTTGWRASARSRASTTTSG